MRKRAYRVELRPRKMLRERIEEGMVLIDIEGEKRSAQVNGLAVLDVGRSRLRPAVADHRDGGDGARRG